LHEAFHRSRHEVSRNMRASVAKAIKRNYNPIRLKEEKSKIKRAFFLWSRLLSGGTRFFIDTAVEF